MITPQDIQTQEFRKGVRGYNEEDVDAFLDQLTESMQQLMDENSVLKTQIADLQERLEGYKQQEGAVLTTLEAAKSLMSDISASAEKRADILLKNAQLDAELKQRQALESVERLKQEENELMQRVSVAKARFKSYLESELERFNGLSEEIFGSEAGEYTEVNTISELIPPKTNPSFEIFNWDNPSDDISKTKIREIED